MSNFKKLMLGAAVGIPDQTYWLVVNTNTDFYSGGNGITSDNDQNVYTSGIWYDPLITGGTQAFVESYDLDGNYRWSKGFGGTLNDSFNSIVSDGTDIYFHGYLRGGLPSAGTNNENGVIKINASGASQWQKIFGANAGNGNSLTSASTNGKSNIIAGGNQYTVQTHGSSNAIFVTKYNTSGTQQFKYKITGNYDVTAHAIQVDSSGNMYICGRIKDTSAGTNYNGYIVKTNSSGVVQWTHMHGGTGFDVVEDILISGSDLYASGRTDSGNVCRVMKLSTSNGSVTWQKKMYASSNLTIGHSLQMDSTGALYVLCYEANYKSVLIKLDSSNGNTTWARRFRDGHPDQLRKSLHRLAFDKYDNMIISGSSLSYSSTWSQHRGQLICKLPNDGTGTGTYTFPSPFWAIITYESVSLTNTTLGADVSSTSVSWSTTTPSLTEQNPNLTFRNTGLTRSIQTVTAG